MAEEKLKTTESAVLSDDAIESVTGGYSIKHPMTKEAYLESIGLSDQMKPDPDGISDDGF